MTRPRPRCFICGMEHAPGNCAAFEHLADQVMHLSNADRELNKRAAYASQLAFAVDDLIANAASPKYRAQAIAKLRRIRKRFANL